MTETDAVAAALDAAARRWPGERRARLIARIVVEWHEATGGASQQVARSRLVGSIPGSSVLYDRAEDWPA